MNRQIANDIASVEISTLGAEALSFKTLKDDCEYLWDGNKTYWGGHAPLLFPIVCAVNQGKIKIDGTEYALGNHGFARKSEFTVIEESEKSITFQLTDNKETFQMYPYHFQLNVIYTLVENELNIRYVVKNTDHKTIYFQLGTHSGFHCPLTKDEKFEDYYLEFEHNETLNRLFMNGDNVLIKDKSENILQNDHLLPLTRPLFENGALVFKSINSKMISLKSKASDKDVTISFENLPYLGLWQAKNAPFVCIEPWYGIADTEGFDGEFKDKEMIIALDQDKSFECSLTIEIA